VVTSGPRSDVPCVPGRVQQNVNGVIVHYVYNTETGEVDDFKFK
jgi:hypothetical protein